MGARVLQNAVRNHWSVRMGLYLQGGRSRAGGCTVYHAAQTWSVPYRCSYGHSLSIPPRWSTGVCGFEMGPSCVGDGRENDREQLAAAGGTLQDCTGGRIHSFCSAVYSAVSLRSLLPH